MLDAMIAHYTSGNKAKFATLLGVSAQTISAWGARNTFDSELIYTKCVGLSSEWLLTGDGAMLRDSKNPEETTMDHGTEKVQSTSSDTIALRMMDKLDEKDNIIKEKDAKIDQLQSELLSAKEELATLNARYPDTVATHPEGLGSSETAPHAHSHPHSPTSEHYYGGSLPPHQENQ